MAMANKRPLLITAGVLVLLALVSFVIGFLMRPAFVTTWPELAVQEGGAATVTFTAQNRTDGPLRKRLIISVGDKRPTSAKDLTHPVVGRQDIVLELAPNETREVRFEFPPTERPPTLAWVELAKE